MSSVWNVTVFKQESTLSIYPKKYNAKMLRQPEQQKISIYRRSNQQNNNFICLEAHFSVHFFAVVVAREQRETSYLHVFKLKNNEKFQQVNATAIRVCWKWIHPRYVLTTKFTCAHTQKKCCLWSCSLFFFTTAHFHLAGRYSICHFLIAGKKVFMLFFFSTKSVSLAFSSRFSYNLGQNKWKT